MGFAVTASEGQEYRQSGAVLGKKGVVVSSAEKGKAIKTAQAGVSICASHGRAASAPCFFGAWATGVPRLGFYSAFVCPFLSLDLRRTAPLCSQKTSGTAGSSPSMAGHEGMNMGGEAMGVGTATVENLHVVRRLRAVHRGVEKRAQDDELGTQRTQRCYLYITRCTDGRTAAGFPSQPRQSQSYL